MKHDQIIVGTDVKEILFLEPKRADNSFYLLRIQSDMDGWSGGPSKLLLPAPIGFSIFSFHPPFSFQTQERGDDREDPVFQDPSSHGHDGMGWGDFFRADFHTLKDGVASPNACLSIHSIQDFLSPLVP